MDVVANETRCRRRNSLKTRSLLMLPPDVYWRSSETLLHHPPSVCQPSLISSTACKDFERMNASAPCGTLSCHDARRIVGIAPDTLLSWTEMNESNSYPTLPTQYWLHQIEAVVQGLPSQDFSTIEGKTEHFWVWQNDLQSEGAAKVREETEEDRKLRMGQPMLSLSKWECATRDWRVGGASRDEMSQQRYRTAARTWAECLDSTL